MSLHVQNNKVIFSLVDPKLRRMKSKNSRTREKLPNIFIFCDFKLDEIGKSVSFVKVFTIFVNGLFIYIAPFSVCVCSHDNQQLISI